MANQILKIKCEICGIEKDVIIKVPRFCGVKCKAQWMRGKRKHKLGAEKEIIKEENGNPTITTDTIAAPEGNPSDIRPVVATENPVDAAPEPAGNTGEVQG